MPVRWEDRIAIDPDVLGGKPIVKGTRLAVEFIIELLAEGWSESELLRNYPALTHEDVRASLRYARLCLAGAPASDFIQTAPAGGMKPTLADFFVLLDSLDWPDEDFGRDLKAIQAAQPGRRSRFRGVKG